MTHHLSSLLIFTEQTERLFLTLRVFIRSNNQYKSLIYNYIIIYNLNDFGLIIDLFSILLRQLNKISLLFFFLYVYLKQEKIDFLDVSCGRHIVNHFRTLSNSVENQLLAI